MSTRLPSPAPGDSGARARGSNTATTFPRGTAVALTLVTDDAQQEPVLMRVLYTDNTGICGQARRGEAPSGDSPVRLFPWAVVESVTRELVTNA